MLATKDHFMLIASSDKIGTELWSGYTERIDVQTTNAIGILCAGEVSAFLRANNAWESYVEAQAPLVLVRPHFNEFGIAAKAEVTKFGCMLPRESHALEQISALSNAGFEEFDKIENSNETVDVYEKCKNYELRDLDTFEIVHPDLVSSDFISDSEIEIEGI